MTLCEDCGASVRKVTCSELFLDLLAADHSRQPPWGPLHGVVTALFFLQHPSDPRASPEQDSLGLFLVHSYLAGGQPALASATDKIVSRNRSRSSRGCLDAWPAEKPVSVANRGSGKVTIHDVAVDDTFPAEGHEERVRLWAESVAAAWAE